MRAFRQISTFVTATVAAMFVATAAYGAATPIYVQHARFDNAQALYKKVADLKLADGKTIAEALPIQGKDPKVKSSELLAGTEEQQPAVYYDDHSVEVKWRLALSELQKNLDAIAERASKDGAPVEYKLTDTNGSLEVASAGDVPDEEKSEDSKTPPKRIMFYPPADVKGWGDVAGYKRYQWQAEALKKAHDSLVAEVRALKINGDLTIQDFLARDINAAEAFNSNLAKLPAEYVALYAGPLVEAEMRVPVSKIIDALKAANDKMPADKKLDAAKIDALANGEKKEFVTHGYASPEGVAQTPPEFKYARLQTSEIPVAQLAASAAAPAQHPPTAPGNAAPPAAPGNAAPAAPGNTAPGNAAPANAANGINIQITPPPAAGGAPPAAPAPTQGAAGAK
jgi:hypothetical protein